MTQEQENVADIERFLVDFAQGNVQALIAAMSDDVEFRIPGPPGIQPFRPVYRGQAGAIELLSTLAEVSEPERLDVHDIIAQRDKVIVLFDERTRAKLTGRVFEQRSAYVWTLREGRIVTCEVFEDTYATVTAYRRDTP